MQSKSAQNLASKCAINRQYRMGVILKLQRRPHLVSAIGIVKMCNKNNVISSATAITIVTQQMAVKLLASECPNQIDSVLSSITKYIYFVTLYLSRFFGIMFFYKVDFYTLLSTSTGLLQPDCLHGLRTTLRYVLVHPLSFFQLTRV